MIYLFIFILIGIIAIWIDDNVGEFAWSFFFLATGCLFAHLIYTYNTDPEWIKDRADREAAVLEKRRADEQPRVIREVDGCKVYAFLSADRWHYFTRCKDMTTTETSWEECRMSGKTRTCETKTEAVVVAK